MSRLHSIFVRRFDRFIRMRICRWDCRPSLPQNVRDFRASRWIRHRVVKPALHANDFEIRPVRDFVIVFYQHVALVAPSVAGIRG